MPNRPGMRRATRSTTRAAVASRLVGGEQEEVRVLAEHRGLAALIRCALTTAPGLLGLAEDGGQPDREWCRRQDVAQHLPGADQGNWSTSPTSSRCAPAEPP